VHKSGESIQVGDGVSAPQPNSNSHLKSYTSPEGDQTAAQTMSEDSDLALPQPNITQQYDYHNLPQQRQLPQGEMMSQESSDFRRVRATLSLQKALRRRLASRVDQSKQRTQHTYDRAQEEEKDSQISSRDSSTLVSRMERHHSKIFGLVARAILSDNENHPGAPLLSQISSSELFEKWPSRLSNDDGSTLQSLLKTTTVVTRLSRWDYSTRCLTTLLIGVPPMEQRRRASNLLSKSTLD
jgi:hypothetical protein